MLRGPNTIVVVESSAPYGLVKEIQDAAYHAQVAVMFTSEDSTDAAKARHRLTGEGSDLYLEHETFKVGTGKVKDRYPIRRPVVFLVLVSVLQ